MWGLIDPNGVLKREESAIDESSETKLGWRWLPINDTPNPKYNPKIETLDGPNFTILEDSIERYWTVRDKTQEEINSEKIVAIDSLSPALIDILLNMENKIRALNGLSEISKRDFLVQIKEII